MQGDSSEWKLLPDVFRQIMKQMGDCQIDLFASHLTTQLNMYMSWRPDPGAVVTYALITPIWPTQLWFPMLVSMAIRRPITDPSSTRPVEESQGRKSPPNLTRVTESSRRVSLRRSLTEEGISEEASKLIMSSWRGNTEAGWKRWERWCVERGY